MPKLVKLHHVRKIPPLMRNPLFFLRQIWRGFRQAGGFSCCSSLSYTLLLAFIPFSIAMASLSVWLPFSNKLVNDVEFYFFNEFLPQSGHEMYTLFRASFQSSRKISIAGAISLLVSSYGMMLAITQSINQILRVKRSRKFIPSLILITLFFILGALIVYSEAFFYSRVYQFVNQTILEKPVEFVVKHSLTFLTYIALYKFLPNKNVKLSHASFAGALATLAFIGLQSYFSWSMINLREEYSLLYGSLVTLPIFLMWIYLSVLILLLGAQFVFFLENKSKIVD